MGRIALWLLCAGCLSLVGCNGDIAPATADGAVPPMNPAAKPPGLELRLDGSQRSGELEFDPEQVAPWEDPLKSWRRQNAQTLSDWVQSLQSRNQIEFTALDHRKWHGLAPLLEYIPYSYYLLVIGEYPLAGEFQVLFLYNGEGFRQPFANIVRFPQPPTTEQQLAIVWPPRRRNIPLSREVWVEGNLAATGGSSMERVFNSRWSGPIDDEVAAAGDHALIAAVVIDSSFRFEATHRFPTISAKQPLEARWLRLQTKLTAVITVADIDPELSIELRLYPSMPEDAAVVARELQALLEAARLRWASLDPAAYEQQHDSPTDPLLWELVRNLLHESRVKVESDGVVVAHWTAQPELRQRLLEVGPHVLKQLNGRAVERQRRRQMTRVAQALEVYLRHNHHVFPTDICDDQGQPLLSWRVKLLPYIDDTRAQSAYQQLNPMERWDSPHNAMVLSSLPPELFAANPDTPDNHADIVAIRGPGLGFCAAPGTAAVRAKDFASLKQTALLVEVAPEASVPVGKPDDLDWTADDALWRLGPVDNDYFYATLGAGHVVLLPKDGDRAKLHALFSRGGGQ